MSSGRVGPGSSWWQRVKRRARRAVLTTAAATVVFVLLTAFVAVAYSGQRPYTLRSETVAGSTPVSTRLYIDPQMLAIAAAREDSRFEPIAETPQAKWFNDWSTAATVRSDVGDYLSGAAAANAVPTIVLYRIPERDCGSWSRGGAGDEQEYKDWVDGVAAALMGHDDAIVILEPDALPGLPCPQGDRLGILSYAVDALSTTGARVYIDAGHEKWWSAAETADRLKRVGVDKVAGFSLNVSNYYPTESEVRYAESVRSQLSKLGVTDSHYVIDISRNGAGPHDDWCNPPGARLGHAPQLFRGAALDGLLWVKHPGEPDGACRGVPEVAWWAPEALSLLGLEEAQATGARSTAGWIAVLSVAAGVVAAGGVLGLACGKRRRNAGRGRLGESTRRTPE